MKPRIVHLVSGTAKRAWVTVRWTGLHFKEILDVLVFICIIIAIDFFFFGSLLFICSCRRHSPQPRLCQDSCWRPSSTNLRLPWSKKRSWRCTKHAHVLPNSGQSIISIHFFSLAISIRFLWFRGERIAQAMKSVVSLGKCYIDLCVSLSPFFVVLWTKSVEVIVWFVVIFDITTGTSGDIS